MIIELQSWKELGNFKQAKQPKFIWQHKTKLKLEKGDDKTPTPSIGKQNPHSIFIYI